VFSDEDLERLRSFPEINREDLIRFFTLTPADVEFIDPGRGPSDTYSESTTEVRLFRIDVAHFGRAGPLIPENLFARITPIRPFALIARNGCKYV
jgi:hypothetical protein